MISQTIILWVRYVRTFSRIYGEIVHSLRETDITAPQLDILVCLHRGGSLPLNEIAKRLLLSGGNVTGVVDRLERDGFVKRIRSTEDRRIVNIAITEQGIRTVKQVLPIYDRKINAIFSGLTVKERKTFRRLLKKVSSKL